MIQRQTALSQLNLLRHADNPAVSAAAETVIWLDEQLERREISLEQFNRIVLQHYELINSIDRPVCQICSHTLKDILESENTQDEDI
jgi:hypothetical protein